MTRKLITLLGIIAISLMLCGCSGDKVAEVDIDLTALSETTMFAELSNALTAPDDYDKKTIKVKGKCATYHDEKDNKDYYALVMVDSTGCCSQVLEFDLADGESAEAFVNDKDVTIRGTFSFKKVDDHYFCRIVDVTAVEEV